MKKLLFILNPFAGQRKANKLLTEIVEIFNRADYEVTVYITAGQDDARRTAKHYAEQMDVIVCCGGDGTFNETVTGILRSTWTECTRKSFLDRSAWACRI